MDPTVASLAANFNGSLHLTNGSTAAYQHVQNGTNHTNGYVTSPLQSPGFQSENDGRKSPGISRSNGATTPSSLNGTDVDAENRSSTPKEERLIVGVDFGTTYSG
jgi:hypothetical protein